MVDPPGTGVEHGSLHSEDTPLPRSMKHRFVFFDLDLAEAIHAAHVVHAVHQRTSLGFLLSHRTDHGVGALLAPRVSPRSISLCPRGRSSAAGLAPAKGGPAVASLNH